MECVYGAQNFSGKLGKIRVKFLRNPQNFPAPTPMSNTTVNGCDLTPLKRTQISEQEYSDLTVSNRRASTSYIISQQLPLLFARNSVVCFIEVDKTCVDVFGILPGFHKKLLEIENLVCSATFKTKTTTGYPPILFQYFMASFFKPLGRHFYWKAKERNASVVSAFLSIRLLVYGDDHPSLPIFQCPS